MGQPATIIATTTISLKQQQQLNQFNSKQTSN